MVKILVPGHCVFNLFEMLFDIMIIRRKCISNDSNNCRSAKHSNYNDKVH